MSTIKLPNSGITHLHAEHMRFIAGLFFRIVKQDAPIRLALRDREEQ